MNLMLVLSTSFLVTGADPAPLIAATPAAPALIYSNATGCNPCNSCDPCAQGRLGLLARLRARLSGWRNNSCAPSCTMHLCSPTVSCQPAAQNCCQPRMKLFSWNRSSGYAACAPSCAPACPTPSCGPICHDPCQEQGWKPFSILRRIKERLLPGRRGDDCCHSCDVQWQPCTNPGAPAAAPAPAPVVPMEKAPENKIPKVDSDRPIDTPLDFKEPANLPAIPVPGRSGL